MTGRKTGWDPDMRKEGIHMKQTARKFLSLLMAFAIVLTLAPTAWATPLAGGGDGTSSQTLTLDPNTLNLKMGGTTTGNITCSNTPQGATLSWESSNTNVATVYNGTVTAVAAGSATITASCEVTGEDGSKTTYSGTCSVTVEAADQPQTPTITEVKLDKTTLNFAADSTTGQTVTATLKGENLPQDAAPTWELEGTDKDDFQISGSGKTVTVAPKTTNTSSTARSASLKASYTANNATKSASCTISMAAAAAAPTVQSVAFDSSTLALTADGAPKTVKVIVTGSDGKAMPGQTVTVTKTGDGDSAIATDSATTGTDGKASISVTPVAGKTGTTTFEASVGAIKSSVLTVTVSEPTYTISVVPAANTVATNTSLDLTVTKSANAPADATVNWVIDPSTGATITPVGGNAYVFRATTAGTYKVTAKLMPKAAGTALATSTQVTIKVTDPSVVGGTLTLNESTVNLTNSSKSFKIQATFDGTVEGNLANSYYVKYTVSPAGIISIVNDDPRMMSDKKSEITTVNAVKNGTATITATLMSTITKEAVPNVNQPTCTVKVERTGYYLQTTGNYPGEGTSHKLYAQGTTTYPSSKTFSVTPYSYADGSTTLPKDVSVSYKWTLNNVTLQDSNYVSYPYQYTLYYDNANLSTTGRTLTCTATFTNSAGTLINRDDISWTVSTDTTSQIPVGVTVYDSNPGYALGSAPDTGSTSIADQIESRIRTLYGSYNYSYYTVTFGSVGGTSSSYKGYLDASTSRAYYDTELEDITFVPNTTISTSTGSETVSFGFTVNVYRYSGSASSAYDARYTGTMTFTIKQGDSTAGDIFYSAEKGENVTFDLDDFEDFWTDYQRNGSLSYITIDSITGGRLYTSDGKPVSTNDTLYASPSRSGQRDLDGVYFTPSSRTTSTGKVTFTAHGSRTGTGSSNTRRGTVSISFLSGAASAITYSTNASGTATLKAQDFIDAYKEATGTRTNPTNLTIQFQEVPSYGTLTYRNGNRDVKLTSSNVKSYKLTAKASGTSQVESVTYSVTGGRTETITYTGYIGNTATFTGEVTFNTVTAVTNVNVYLPTCYSAAGVALSSSYFTTANAAVSGASYVILGSPRTGRLTNSAGSALAPNTVVQLGSLGTVTYVPTASGTDSFTFTAYNSSNTQVASGTVTVVSVLTTVTTPGAITSITQLTDIPTNATANWYRDKLTYLINKGMINGKGNGKFGPEDQVEYSEALKFIMNAAGIVREESKVGNWAQNYLNTAVQNGWVSGTVDLTKPIPRTAMAELTARILGIPASSAASPFTDTNNQWVTALYNATFTANGTTGRIIQGSNDLNGRLCFNPDSQLTRAEMVTLVYNMYMYKGN